MLEKMDSCQVNETPKGGAMDPAIVHSQTKDAIQVNGSMNKTEQVVNPFLVSDGVANQPQVHDEEIKQA